MSSTALFGGLTSLASGLATTAGTSASSGGLGQAQDYLDALQNNFGTPGVSSPQASAINGAVSNLTNSFSLFATPSRFAAFVIGVLLIGGGILVFVFQPSVAGARAAAKKAILA